MTAKEFVKVMFPKAIAERQVNGRHEVYWLIRNGRNTMYMANGKSESNAWVNAKQSIMKGLKALESLDKQ